MDLVSREALCVDRAGLAKLLGVSIRTIYRLDDSGHLPPPIRLGSSKRWSVIAIEEWLASGAPPRRRTSRSALPSLEQPEAGQDPWERSSSRS
jgi:predicted DNA-binding transcriptional regulator AlpA